jgi:uncharacterized protein YycO
MNNPYNFKHGDLIFADGYTVFTLYGEYKSKFMYNHVAMIIIKDNDIFVLESDYAYNGVRIVSFDEFLKNTVTNKIGVRRRKCEFRKKQKEELEKVCYKYIGSPYDWDSVFNTHKFDIKTTKDNKFMCTGLITKILIDIGEIEIEYDYNYYEPGDFQPHSIIKLNNYYNDIEPIKKEQNVSFVHIIDIIHINMKLIDIAITNYKNGFNVTR